MHNFGCLTGAPSTLEHVAEYLDLEAVAEILGVDRDAAYLVGRTGELRGIKIAVGWRVERTDALRYKDSH